MERAWNLLETRRPFSESVLWDLQRRYFASKGILAWQDGEVPDYVTTNPTVANSYAEIVFAFDRDRRQLAPDETGDPLHLCELGAGSGRFAFHFLRRLEALCDQFGVPFTRFRYILTDFVEENLTFFEEHPRFREYFEAGVLETSLFDVAASDSLQLRRGGATLAPGTLARPLVVLANYVFDSVPQDYFHVHDGRCDRALVSVGIKDDSGDLDAAGMLARAEYQLEFEPLAAAAYEETELQAILASYQDALRDAYVSFPIAGLRCLTRLKRLSARGLLLLSADKGYHAVADSNAVRLGMARHGSFSVDVNYDAFRRFCESDGGVALLPAFHHESLSVSALLMVERAPSHVETRRAYRRHVEEFGPDDFFSLSRYLRKNISEMSIGELLACVRLSHHDSTQFNRYLPRLMELAADLGADGRRAVGDAIEKVWDLYFPLGEPNDLAFEIARALYEIDDYRGAIRFFERSNAIYGERPITLCNMALCYRMLGDAPAADAAIRRTLAIDPANPEAMQLLAG